MTEVELAAVLPDAIWIGFYLASMILGPIWAIRQIFRLVMNGGRDV